MTTTACLELAVVAAGLVTLSAIAHAQSAPLVHDTVLANGLTILVAENHTVPIATVEVVVRTGAFTQQRGEEGSSHLFEHLLFRAYGADQKFGVEVADMEGTSNGSTTEESVSYYITAPAKEARTAVGMMAQLIIKPRFRDEDIEAERQIVTSEFETDASDPDFLLRAETGHRLWGDDWYKRDALGTRQSIEALSADRLRQIFEQFYVPGRSALVVSGDVRTADMFAEAAHRFGGWKPTNNSAPSSTVQQASTLTTSQVFAVSAPHQRLVSVRISWLGPSVQQDPTSARAASLFADMVNSPVSPFVTRLVASGLVESAELAYTPQANGGPVALDVTMLPSAVDRAIPALRAEIDRFSSSEYLNDTLLAMAKKARAVDAAFSFERGSGIAHTLGFWWAIAGTNAMRANEIATDQLSLASVEQFVTSTLQGRPWVAGALCSNADLDRVTRSMTQAFGGHP